MILNWLDEHIWLSWRGILIYPGHYVARSLHEAAALFAWASGVVDVGIGSTYQKIASTSPKYCISWVLTFLSLQRDSWEIVLIHRIPEAALHGITFSILQYVVFIYD